MFQWPFTSEQLNDRVPNLVFEMLHFVVMSG